MDWYQPLVKTAKEIGHGDTFEGQMLTQQKKRLAKEIDHLRMVAATGGPEAVLPRWRGEIRSKILLLPPVVRIENMSMFEVAEASVTVDLIKQSMDHYSAKRFMEIIGDASHPR